MSVKRISTSLGITGAKLLLQFHIDKCREIFATNRFLSLSDKQIPSLFEDHNRLFLFYSHDISLCSVSTCAYRANQNNDVRITR